MGGSNNSGRQDLAPDRLQKPSASVQAEHLKLEIQKFKGEPTQWPTFWDQFESTSDKNEGLANVDKLKYLKSDLMGRAEGVIRGLSTTNGKYETTLCVLRRRFGQPPLIINEHMSYLLKLKKIHSSYDLEGRRDYKTISSREFDLWTA